MRESKKGLLVSPYETRVSLRRWYHGDGWKPLKRDAKTDESGGRGVERKIGWGGRIRTFTILINSEVSYRLDHAPAVGQNVGNACRAARPWPCVCSVSRAADAV